MKKQEDCIRKMKLEDYEIGRTLGKGGFGKVKIAKNKKTGKYFALNPNKITHVKNLLKQFKFFFPHLISFNGNLRPSTPILKMHKN